MVISVQWFDLFDAEKITKKEFSEANAKIKWCVL